MTPLTPPEPAYDDLAEKTHIPGQSRSSNGGMTVGGSVAQGMSEEPDDAKDLPEASNKIETVKAADDATVIQRPMPVVPAPDMASSATKLAPAAAAESFESPSLVAAFVETANYVETPLAASDATFIGTVDMPRNDESSIGRVIGPYTVIGELGRGGMGVVYKARHRQLHREVALKMILRAADADAEILSRFEAEAQSVATLIHPGIVQIYEYGKHEGVPWFSLEFVEGKTLAQLTAKQPLDPKRAAGIVADLAAAVAFAHEHGVLHRDIKPANVLMGVNDVPKLTDFGIAKRAAADEDATDHKTIDGQIMGTPSYMPPEQARGATSLVGPHSDQYSLGATLYHLLTGRPPFVGTRAIDVILQVTDRDPLGVRQLQPSTPLDLETICLKTLAKEPARRYPDCAALEADLRRFLRNEPIVARPISRLERSIRWCRRNPKIAIPAATAVVSVLTALSVSVWSASALASKNVEIEHEKNEAVGARKLADLNAETATKHARLANENAKLAYQRAVNAKDSVAQMLFAIREKIPSAEEKLRPVREQLLRIASDQLDRLPDASDDSTLNVGLEKARILEAQYLTELELGQSSKAIEHLDAAERILRERNDAQGTDDTRRNLVSVLFRQMEARLDVQRDLERVIQFGVEALTILDDVLAHPKSAPVEAEAVALSRLNTLTTAMMVGYRLAHALRKVGRVRQALDVIDRAIGRFDESMISLRLHPNFKGMADSDFERLKPAFRGNLADHDQLRAILLASVGRDDEAKSEQQRISDNLDQFANNDSSPGRIESTLKRSLALVFAGDLARQRGEINEALVFYEESVRITGALYASDPALADRRNRHLISLMRLAGILRARDLPRARQLSTEAWQVAKKMVDTDTRAVTNQIALALASPFAGPPENAANLAEEILSRIRDSMPLDAELAIDLARVFASSAEAMSFAGSRDIEAEARWKARSLGLITQAVTDGYRDGAFLAGEPDFHVMKDLPEFTQLIQQCARAETASTKIP